jgi:hypothetical protein
MKVRANLHVSERLTGGCDVLTQLKKGVKSTVYVQEYNTVHSAGCERLTAGCERLTAGCERLTQLKKGVNKY